MQDNALGIHSMASLWCLLPLSTYYFETKVLGNKITTNSFTNPPLLTHSTTTIFSVYSPQTGLQYQQITCICNTCSFPREFSNCAGVYTRDVPCCWSDLWSLSLWLSLRSLCPKESQISPLPLWLVFFLGCLDENTCTSVSATISLTNIRTLHHKPVYTPSHKYTLIQKMYTVKPGFYILRMVFPELLRTISMIPAKCPLEQCFPYSYTFPGFYAICRWPS